MKIFKKVMWAFALMVLVVPFGVFAKSNASQMVVVRADEVIEDTFFVAAGERVDIAGRIEGDVVVAGGTVVISGSVDGDVLAAGGSVVISGRIDGDVRIIGGEITIQDSVGGNVSAVGGSVIIEKESRVEGGVLAVGGLMEIRGEVAKEIRFAGGATALSGVMRDDVSLWLGDDGDQQALSIHPDARIVGELYYKARNEITVPAGVTEHVVFEKTTAMHAAKDKKSDAGGAVLMFIIKFFALLLVALVVTAFVPKALQHVKEYAYIEPNKRMLIGVAWLLLVPIGAVVLMLTLIGIPLAILTMMMYVVGLCLVRVFAAYVIGSYVLQLMKKKKVSPFWTVALGLFVYLLIAAIPFVGVLFTLVMTIWMIGAVAAFKEHEMARYR